MQPGNVSNSCVFKVLATVSIPFLLSRIIGDFILIKKKFDFLLQYVHNLQKKYSLGSLLIIGYQICELTIIASLLQQL
jgi:hypothetical protein